MSNPSAAAVVTPIRRANHHGRHGLAKWLLASAARYFKAAAGNRLAGEGTGVLYRGM